MIAPPFVSLAAVRDAISGSPVRLGAQDLFHEDSGAFTGEVSAPMLVEAGCSYVIVGHSERRAMFGDTDETVNRKVRSALRHGLRPVMCVGESLSEREAGRTLDVVLPQVRRGLAQVAGGDAARAIVAYEPIWAIGTGRTATSAQAQEVQAAIRAALGELYGKEPAGSMLILYGGSVTPGNAFELCSQPDIDGALVGGASLKAESFQAVIAAADRARPAS
jgi:triosephosphate isomerase